MNFYEQIMKKSMSKISIVIPTFNRVDALIDALGAIQRQTLKDFEVIVVDNGPSIDGTGKRVREFAQKDDRFVYVSTAEKGDFVARTIGCYRAQADLILTTDDDWEMTDKETLAYIIRCFDEDEKLGVLGLSEYYPDGKAMGQVVSCAVPRNWKQILMDTKLYHPGRINRWGMIGTKFYYLPMGQKHRVDHVRSSCMAFRREVAERFGYFSTFYVIKGDGYRSETELCHRFARAGYNVVFTSELQGLHKVRPRGHGVTPRSQTPEFLYNTGRNNMLFFLRNYWSRSTSFVFFLWDVLIGNSTQPGFLRFFTTHCHLRNKRNIIASLRGKGRGFIEYHTKYHNLQVTS